MKEHIRILKYIVYMFILALPTMCAGSAVAGVGILVYEKCGLVASVILALVIISVAGGIACYIEEKRK